MRSDLTFGHCAPDPATACASDADCVSPARCLRGAETVQVAGLLSVAVGAKITARGTAATSDTIGPDGGALTLSAHDVSLAGTVSVSTQGTTGVPAGHAGRIGIDADGTVTLAASAFLDASSSSGGCGGAIGVGNGAKTPVTLTAGGQLSVDGATLGGTIELVAGDQLTLLGTLRASNTNTDRSRPVCAEGAGGGTIRLEAASVDFDGSARARGTQAAGGVVRLDGVRAVTLDFPGAAAAISVTGGDAFRFTPGGGVFISASAGDVVVREGVIEADGISTGFGSDAGLFSLIATGTTQCLAGGTPCASGAECAAGDPCVESGGQVMVQAPLSAAGGAGLGSGCVACEVRGTGAVTVSAAIDVSGGQQGGVGGKLSLTGGGDLTVGPGPISADGFDGGDIILTAGSRIGAARDIGGALQIVNGTQVTAAALQDNRFGGDVELEGCDVTLEPSTALVADGGSRGHAGHLDVTAHERLAIESLATLSALPDGASALTYRLDESIAPDAVLQPTFTLVTDPTLTPCPACGNGQIDPLEDCDGRGTCTGPGAVCVPPGSPGECTCAMTCGTVAGIQPGEDCDGADLGGATCVSLGFGGGTLACSPDCAFDTSQCGPERCGDGLVGPDEQCDPGGTGGVPPPNFRGVTCPAGGSLACAPDCSAIITVPHCALTVTQACT
ncbi:MAG TPA: hypothetical protein VMR79_00430, partial [Verrucomicrobiae bacterium]|nr:hypothetical protein [Verrucomicrobiae bacterium]